MIILRKPKLVVVLFAFTSLLLSSIPVSVSHSELTYADHCASVVPESNSKIIHRIYPFSFNHIGYYYTDGETANSVFYHHRVSNSIQFNQLNVEETDVEGLFKLEGTLHVSMSSMMYYIGNSSIRSTPAYQMSVSFRLNGFWSESSGKLCMVGYGHLYWKTLLRYPAVLKLYNARNSTNITSLITGTLESLISSSDMIKDEIYFGPTSILMLPRMNSQYSFISYNSSGNRSSVGIDDHDLPSSLYLERFCSHLSTVVANHEYDLIYSSQCVSAKKCDPLGVSNHLPRLLSFKDIECSENNRRLRVLVEFSDSKEIWRQRPFSLTTSLIAEGSWDAKNNQIQFVACKFFQAATFSFNNSHVEDCSTRLSLRYPAIWTIGSTSKVVGKIWSTKSKTDSRYFNMITFQTHQSEAGSVIVTWPKYVYTKIDQVTKLCPKKKSAASSTLSCVFVALQLFHVNKVPDVLPSISILMLFILTLGHTTVVICLMLNLIAKFTRITSAEDVFIGTGGWVEVSEINLRLVAIVAFLLHFPLLQKTWSARSANGKQRELWDVEKKALPVYAVGFLVPLGLLMNYRIYAYTIFVTVSSYASLVSDGFLFPQILLNTVCESKEKALSAWFYIGTTSVRVLPHAYDLYRTHNYAHLKRTIPYIYASHVADTYSTSRDVIIPIGCLLFCVIIFLQQTFGGRCFLPKKSREKGSYEKVPTASELPK